MDRLRIIGGEWRGRRLAMPDAGTTRPLTDRIKESLCNVLGQTFDGRRVIDTCAGSGSFGFECASRGAIHVDLIEFDPKAADVLNANADQLDAHGRCTIHRGSCFDVLPRLEPADVVFCDPPFPWADAEPERLGQLLEAARARLTSDGQVVLRLETGQPAPQTSARQVDERRYGRSVVRFFGA